MLSSRIARLDEKVVNRIAAGEVIQGPANALKELIENALDAGSTRIQIHIKQGGLGMLKIQDNGCGIQREDLPILCERFTTSKLTKFEDLRQMQTYGFRGEALASISHVSKLLVVTRPATSDVAYRCWYLDGAPDPAHNGGEPEPTHGNVGTTLVSHDLFFNVANRLKALRPRDEQRKIVEVVTRYAVHNYTIGFSLTKDDDRTAVVNTREDAELIDTVRGLYGSEVAKALMPVKVEDPGLKVSLHGLLSDANYSTKKLTFLLFVNHRLVESPALRRAIDAVYSRILPKGSHPFVYLALSLAPENVDVNVHPTKQTVHILNEDAVISLVQHAFEQKLGDGNQVRSFSQTTLTAAKQQQPPQLEQLLPPTSASAVTVAVSSTSPTATATATASTERTERNDGGILVHAGKSSAGGTGHLHQDPYLSRQQTPPPPSSSSSSSSSSSTSSKCAAHARPTASSSQEEKAPDPKRARGDFRSQTLESFLARSSSRPGGAATSAASAAGGVAQAAGRPRLASVTNMLSLVERARDDALGDIFRQHEYVGMVEDSAFLIQSGTGLFLCRLTPISEEVMYQRVLHGFGRFAALRLEPAPGLKDLLLVALRAERELLLEQDEGGGGHDQAASHSDAQLEEAAARMLQVITSKAAMLDDYFCVGIQPDGSVVTLPALLQGCDPCVELLPEFFLHLGRHVNWEMEQSCLEDVSRALARLFALRPDLDRPDPDPQHVPLAKRVENFFSPALRSFAPPKIFLADQFVLNLADTSKLYRVFERC